MITKKKTKKAVAIVDGIVTALKSEKIYKRIPYEYQSEAKTKTSMDAALLNGLQDFYKQMEPHLRDSTIKKKAERSLYWETDKSVTINNIIFLGTQHRPDFLVDIYGLRIGVEIKRGDDGGSIREGIGQSIVYSTTYDFVVYLFIDITPDKKILHSYKGQTEKDMVDSLWQNYNIRFDVV